MAAICFRKANEVIIEISIIIIFYHVFLLLDLVVFKYNHHTSECPMVLRELLSSEILQLTKVHGTIWFLVSTSGLCCEGVKPWTEAISSKANQMDRGVACNQHNQ